jgi:hypothetical protein
MTYMLWSFIFTVIIFWTTFNWVQDERELLIDPTVFDVLSYSFCLEERARLAPGNDAVVLFVYGFLCQAR